MKAAVVVVLLRFSAVVVVLVVVQVIRGYPTSKLVWYQTYFVQSTNYTFEMGKGEGWGEGEGEGNGAAEAGQWENGLCGCFSSCRNCKFSSVLNNTK